MLHAVGGTKELVFILKTGSFFMFIYGCTFDVWQYLFFYEED